MENLLGFYESAATMPVWMSGAFLVLLIILFRRFGQQLHEKVEFYHGGKSGSFDFDDADFDDAAPAKPPNRDETKTTWLFDTDDVKSEETFADSDAEQSKPENTEVGDYSKQPLPGVTQEDRIAPTINRRKRATISMGKVGSVAWRILTVISVLLGLTASVISLGAWAGILPETLN